MDVHSRLGRQGKREKVRQAERRSGLRGQHDLLIEGARLPAISYKTACALRALVETVKEQNPKLWAKYQHDLQAASSDATGQAHVFALQAIDQLTALPLPDG